MVEITKKFIFLCVIIQILLQCTMVESKTKPGKGMGKGQAFGKFLSTIYGFQNLLNNKFVLKIIAKYFISSSELQLFKYDIKMSTCVVYKEECVNESHMRFYPSKSFVSFALHFTKMWTGVVFSTPTICNFKNFLSLKSLNFEILSSI